MREAGALEVRRRVRPCEASYVWVLPVRSDVRSDGAGVRSESACVLSDVRSGVLSGVRSHTEPRTKPQKNHEGSSSRAREVVKSAGTTGRPNTGPRATNARSQQPRKDETRSSNDATRKPGQSLSVNCLEGHRPTTNRRPTYRPAPAETPTATATGGCVWTARASQAQRSVTRFERKTVAGV